MTVGMGIFLAAVVWGVVTILGNRRLTPRPSLWANFIKFIGLVMRGIGRILSWAMAICLLLFLLYALQNMLTSWLGGSFSPSEFVDWDLRQAAFFILAILFICGVYVVPAMILEGNNPIAELFEKFLTFLSKGRITGYWRYTSDFEEKKIFSISKSILFLGMIFTLGLTPRIAEFFHSAWDLHIIPFCMNNQSLVGTVIVVVWIGGIVIGIIRALVHK